MSRVLRDRRDHVGRDVVLLALDGEHVGQTDEAHLRGAVVRLAEVAEDAGGRRGEDDAAVLPLLHHAERGLRDVERALQVDVEDDLEVLRRELRERLVAQDAGVVDDDVDASEAVDRGLDDRLAALGRRDRVVVGDRLAAGRLDLLARRSRPSCGRSRCRRGCRRGRSRRPAAPRDASSSACCLPEAATGAGDDRHAIVESDVSHAYSPSPFRCS